MSADMLFAVLGVQLGYLSAEDALGAARELAQPGERRSLSEFLVARGFLDRARAQVLERLAARAVNEGGGNAAQTLELLPQSIRELKARTAQATPTPSGEARVAVVDEQAHRYFAAPRADRPPEELGHGAFARVVLMHDTVIGRDLAWREPLEHDPESEAQLLAEARQQAGFDHPAVVPIYEAGRGARGLYVTQRRVGSRSLAQAITAATSAEDRLALVPALHTVADCLTKAHERALFHRELNCGHVSLGNFGEVYLLGWGPPVPEAERAAAALDDLRGLGAMLHEVVTGLPPPVMGAVRARGAPDDLLGLCRAALAGRGSVEQFALELKAWIDGRRLGSYRYSSWQLLKRYVQRHRLFSAMAATAFLLITVGTSAVALHVRSERDYARQLARRFLDDVALQLRAQPGVEPLLEQVTAAALGHYERTTELARSPREERLRVARAIARLGAVSMSLGRRAEAARSLEFATGLAQSLPQPDAEADLVLAEVALARADAPGLAARDAQAAASEARTRADGALARHDSFEARRLAAGARLLLAEGEALAVATSLLDEAVRLLEPAATGADELVRRQALARALVTRARRVGGTLAEREALLARLETLRERALDDVELGASVAVAHVLVAEATPDLERQRLEGDAAGALARAALVRRPDNLALATVVVEAELLAGRPVAALERARSFEASGLVALGPLTAEAALFAGAFEQARVLSARPPASATSRMVLVRALSSAWLGRVSDAVIQARALKGTFGAGPWSAARLTRALETLPQGPGPGEAAVRQFAARWAEGEGEAAVAGFISTLEAQLPR